MENWVAYFDASSQVTTLSLLVPSELTATTPNAMRAYETARHVRTPYDILAEQTKTGKDLMVTVFLVSPTLHRPPAVGQNNGSALFVKQALPTTYRHHSMTYSNSTPSASMQPEV
jgi:hypothetical protein